MTQRTTQRCFFLGCFETKDGGFSHRLRGWLLLACISSSPEAILGDVLEDVIRKDGSNNFPYFRLDTSQGVLTQDSLSNFTCIAVTGDDVAFVWSLGNHFVVQSFVSETIRVPINSANMDLHLSFIRMNASLLPPGERVNVVCRIQLLRSKPATVTLSAAVRAGSKLLHSNFGDPCKPSSALGGARMCVGEATVCDPRLGPGLCVCDPYHAARYERMRVCLLRKKLGEPCLIDEHCDGRTQRCRQNLCVCQEPYKESNSVCIHNTTLNGVCDDFRVCPEGSACTDNVCKCAAGYYEWGDECLRRVLTDRQGKTVIIGVVVASTLTFVVGMVIMALYFYRHSYRPAVMIERTGSSWDFFPTATTKRQTM